MYLTNEEKDALLRAGSTADQRGRFDHKAAFVDDQVLILLALQDKGLISRDYTQYYITSAGLREKDSIHKEAEKRVNEDRDKRRDKKQQIAIQLVLAIITGIFAIIAALIQR